MCMRVCWMRTHVYMYRVYIHARPARCLCAYLHVVCIYAHTRRCLCMFTSLDVCMQISMCTVCIYAHICMCPGIQTCVVCIPVQWGTSGPVLSAGRVQVALPGGAGQAQCPLPRGCWFQGAAPGELGLGKQNTGGAAPWNGASFPQTLGSRCGSVSAEVGQQARNHAGG